LKFIDNADIGFKTIFDKIEGLAKSNSHIEKGLINMWFSKEMQNFDLYTKHTVFDESKKAVDSIEFELQKNESAGSIKYFIIVCLLSYAIKNSQLIWIDELDARLHSSLLEMLIMSFHNPSINPINSQLIFTTHNTVLLDKKLRRDQMVVIEKNEWDESILKKAHTASKPIRVGKSMEKEYRKGKLGGVSKKLSDNAGHTLFD
jgi:AAA15 family ATPase/GTPase